MHTLKGVSSTRSVERSLILKWKVIVSDKHALIADDCSLLYAQIDPCPVQVLRDDLLPISVVRGLQGRRLNDAGRTRDRITLCGLKDILSLSGSA